MVPKGYNKAISRPIARILHVLKKVFEYQNMDELLFAMISERVEAHALPKFMVTDAKKVVDMRKDARMRAIAKGRYIPEEQKHGRNKQLIEDAVGWVKASPWYKELEKKYSSKFVKMRD